MMMENERNQDENMIQRVIDPQTGSDITVEYVEQRLKELETVANEIIKHATEEYRKEPSKKTEIYKKAYWEIHEKLGQGSIGPATAAAGPLMEKKMMKLAELLDVGEQDRI